MVCFAVSKPEFRYHVCSNFLFLTVETASRHLFSIVLCICAKTNIANVAAIGFAEGNKVSGKALKGHQRLGAILSPNKSVAPCDHGLNLASSWISIWLHKKMINFFSCGGTRIARLPYLRYLLLVKYWRVFGWRRNKSMIPYHWHLWQLPNTMLSWSLGDSKHHVKL